MISSIYNSGLHLYQTGKRKGKSKKKLELESAKFVIYNNKKTKHYKDINLLITKSGDLLNSWELDFLKSISIQKSLSKKQLEVLNKIKLRKCGSTLATKT